MGRDERRSTKSTPQYLYALHRQLSSSWGVIGEKVLRTKPPTEAQPIGIEDAQDGTASAIETATGVISHGRNDFVEKGVTRRWHGQGSDGTNGQKMRSGSSRAVVVVSSINIDTTLHVFKQPSLGETTLATRTSRGLGGKGANVAVAASLSGLARTYLAGAIGEDGKFLLEQLRGFGVDVSHVEVMKDVMTGGAYIILERGGGNRIIAAQGANARFGGVRGGMGEEMEGGVVVLQLEIEVDVVRQAARLGKEGGGTVVLNPSPVTKDGEVVFKQGDEIWNAVDVVVVNEIEARQLTGQDDVQDGLKTLRGWCSRGDVTVVATLGAEGVLFDDGSGMRRVGAAHVQRVVDTTGAGDTFTGYLAAGLAAGRELDCCVREAVAAAAICVQREGAAGAVPTGDEVARVMVDWPDAGAVA